MTISRENRVVLLKNVGQYLIDKAELLIPESDEKLRLRKHVITIEVGVEMDIPKIAIDAEYIVPEALSGVKWGRNP